MEKAKYYIVDAAMLPEVFIKVTQARELLETGQVKTVAEAAERAGISRSAYYKYKDAIAPFKDMKRGHIITFHMMLRDKMGVLSSVLSIFANTRANILTINQSIPSNGVALVTISAETADMEESTEALVSVIRSIEGVLKIEIIAG